MIVNFIYIKKNYSFHYVIAPYIKLPNIITTYVIDCSYDRLVCHDIAV